MTVSIDMTNNEIRGQVIALSGYHALALELIGLKSRHPVLKAMQALGFTSKTKAKMVCELYDYFIDIEGDKPNVTNRVCKGCKTEHGN